MKYPPRNSWLLLLVLFSTGCADPFLYVNQFNPFAQQEWSQDEAYMATHHTKLESLREAGPKLASYSDADQQQWARVLNEIIEHETNPQIRAASVETLAFLPSQISADGLRAAATDSSAKVRMAACKAMATRNDGEAVEVLATVLGSDTNLDVQLAAAKGLGNSSDPRATEALRMALDSKNPALQFRVTQSLARTTPVDYGRDVVAWKQYLNGETPRSRQDHDSFMAKLPFPWRF